MIDPGTPPLNERLRQLLQQFADNLPQRLAELRALEQDLTGAKRLLALQELQAAAHKLAGSLGSFGFGQMSEVARALEQHLQKLLHSPNGDPGLRDINHLLSTMEAMLQAGSDSESTSSEASAIGGAGNSVLLIEDDPLLAQLLREQLQVFGWQVQHCEDASSAAALVQQQDPHIVVIDVMLPEGEMAGLRLLPQLRRHDGSRPELIIMSARWDWEARLEAVRAGITHFFPKPLDINVLVETLDQLAGTQVPAPLRILLIGPDTAQCLQQAERLRAAGMQLDVLHDETQLLERLVQNKPELVLFSGRPHSCTAQQAADVIRQDPVWLGLPILFIQDHVETSHYASDTLSSSIDDATLVQAVHTRASHFRQISNLMRRDGLTGLLNHMSFKEHLRIQLSRTVRSKGALSVAMLDIDHFKQINDRYGHAAGDRVLKAIAQLLKQRLRKYDVVGRYGGEEFVIAFPDTSAAQAGQVMQELLDSFARIRFFADGQEFASSFSAGIAAYPACPDLQTLMETADRRLYEAKREGRRRVVSERD